MRLVNTTSAGHTFVSSATVINELKGCCLLLGESSVTKQSQALLEDINKKVKYPYEKTMLNPVIPLKHGSAFETAKGIEVKTEVTDSWYMMYFGKEIDLISFLLHGLLLTASTEFASYFLSTFFTLLDEQTTPYLMSFIDLSDVVPCLSFVLLRYLSDIDLIQKGIRILGLFSQCTLVTKISL